MTRVERPQQAGTLFVVATPIGHLEDITLRALRILKSVAIVAAEDTRRTGNLLRHYGISTPLLSVHEHNERLRAAGIVGKLQAGESVALVTDAGTPGISDPGAGLVATVRAAGLRVEPIPGASAVIAALSVAGIESNGFIFRGFPPIKAKDRTRWFLEVIHQSSDTSVVFFEAPHRLKRTLTELESVKRPIFAFRELTKHHEESVKGTPSELLIRLNNPKGEFTLVIPPKTGEDDGTPVVVSDQDIVDEFGRTTKRNAAGLASRRDAIRVVARKFSVSTKVVYAALERAKIG